MARTQRLYSLFSKALKPDSKRASWVRLSPAAMPKDRAKSYFSALTSSRKGLELRVVPSADQANSATYTSNLQSFLEGQ